MSETRPVPRRDSPWGTPEGEHRQPKAHRCNDRAEDVIQGQLLLANSYHLLPKNHLGRSSFFDWSLVKIMMLPSSHGISRNAPEFLLNDMKGRFFRLVAEEHKKNSPLSLLTSTNLSAVVRLVLKEILSRQFQDLSSFSGGACVLNLGMEEPTEPYTYLEFDPPKREVKLE
ncbi:hypothetical protein F8388_015469 [Cannabis sativa]|uniref:Uncharacterized protein n=1 Tax=Cannabis sativa TaxID=3483 RepID=A0A7J6GIE1_CANSA|nr:hypothetical protein F8388_015469 [Cannabis sativa]